MEEMRIATEDKGFLYQFLYVLISCFCSSTNFFQSIFNFPFFCDLFPWPHTHLEIRPSQLFKRNFFGALLLLVATFLPLSGSLLLLWFFAFKIIPTFGLFQLWIICVKLSPWGCWELDTTERLHFHSSLSCIGEGNGNPLQCSCLENPRDGGAWWAAISGIAQSRTRLKRLSSSSSSRE